MSRASPPCGSSSPLTCTSPFPGSSRERATERWPGCPHEPRAGGHEMAERGKEPLGNLRDRDVSNSTIKARVGERAAGLRDGGPTRIARLKNPPGVDDGDEVWRYGKKSHRPPGARPNCQAGGLRSQARAPLARDRARRPAWHGVAALPTTMPSGSPRCLHPRIRSWPRGAWC